MRNAAGMVLALAAGMAIGMMLSGRASAKDPGRMCEELAVDGFVREGRRAAEERLQRSLMKAASMSGSWGAVLEIQQMARIEAARLLREKFCGVTPRPSSP